MNDSDTDDFENSSALESVYAHSDDNKSDLARGETLAELLKATNIRRYHGQPQGHIFPES